MTNFKKAHQMTREIVAKYGDVDYAAQFTLCLQSLRGEEKMERKYEEEYKAYRKAFGLAYASPISYEEFEANEIKKEAEKNAIAEAKEKMENPFAELVAEGKKFGPTADETVTIKEEIREKSLAIRRELFDQDKDGNMYKILAIEEYERESRKEISKRPRRNSVPAVATNVYDDDDNPTSH